ncbi:MAG TPA: calcium/sodium antiporter [Candidatus Paceibacterota bacterium]|nr:calcium/sodium antiporter [Candidatus Paceibacterota bacterium]
MPAFSSYALLVVGFVLLLRGAEELVEGSTSLASRLGVSRLIIGLTVVAFGTSAPELAVNAVAALNGETDLAMGNVIGSNLANLLLILGVVALVSPPKLTSGTVWREIPFSFVAVVVLGITANSFMGGIGPSPVSRGDGLILLVFFGWFLFYVFGRVKAERSQIAQDEPRKRTSVAWGVVRLVLGLVGLYFGGQWIVQGATTIARSLGISDYVIASSVIAVGTSLPELAASVVAARKGEPDLAVGNVVGSNIFNIFWILGVTAVIAPIAVTAAVNADLLILGAGTALLFAFMFAGRRHELDRWQGGLLVALYAAYIANLILRG